jgi:asparagine synthase (glutamine-hydrolysing)
MREARMRAGELRQLLEQVVYDHLVSDVPLGAFLSGGIDSSSIVALMSRVAPEAVHTFSVTFREKAFSEAPYSRLVAERYSKHHTEICLGEEQLLSTLTEALNAMDQPTIDGINVYVISKVVREAGVTVVLSGQGGDELFAGYPTFKRVHRLARYRFLWGVVPAAARGLLGKSWSRLSRRDVVGNKVSQILCSDGGVLPVYLIMRQLFSPEARRRLFPREIPPESMVEGLPAEVYAKLREASQGLDPVNQVSLFELQTYLTNMLLRDGDFMSMAHGLEVRVPFLDHRVVELVAQIPGALKVDRSVPKPLLLKVMGDLLPAPIYQRPKSGFTFPWELWLRGRLSSAVAAVLDAPEAGVSIGLAPGVCQRLWDNFLAGKPGITWSRIWGLFVLIEWARLNRAVYDDGG